MIGRTLPVLFCSCLKQQMMNESGYDTALPQRDS